MKLSTSSERNLPSPIFIQQWRHSLITARSMNLRRFKRVVTVVSDRAKAALFAPLPYRDRTRSRNFESFNIDEIFLLQRSYAFRRFFKGRVPTVSQLRRAVTQSY
mmetsp:Transcript_16312/g.33150  ORF Transcript_16312/g.33150 Transcript_16312/m.33150 type:complete len:105 (-) Transcript_16312:147-461(-)